MLDKIEQYLTSKSDSTFKLFKKKMYDHDYILYYIKRFLWLKYFMCTSDNDVFISLVEHYFINDYDDTFDNIIFKGRDKLKRVFNTIFVCNDYKFENSNEKLFWFLVVSLSLKNKQATLGNLINPIFLLNLKNTYIKDTINIISNNILVIVNNIHNNINKRTIPKTPNDKISLSKMLNTNISSIYNTFDNIINNKLDKYDEIYLSKQLLINVFNKLILELFDVYIKHNKELKISEKNYYEYFNNANLFWYEGSRESKSSFASQIIENEIRIEMIPDFKKYYSCIYRVMNSSVSTNLKDKILWSSVLLLHMNLGYQINASNVCLLRYSSPICLFLPKKKDSFDMVEKDIKRTLITFREILDALKQAVSLNKDNNQEMNVINNNLIISNWELEEKKALLKIIVEITKYLTTLNKEILNIVKYCESMRMSLL